VVVLTGNEAVAKFESVEARWRESVAGKVMASAVRYPKLRFLAAASIQAPAPEPGSPTRAILVFARGGVEVARNY